VKRQSTDLSPAARQGYDAIIDVRSPAEFAEDHVPGAINLPVLDNKERAEIGTMFVQHSKFLARRSGAAYVARNIANHLQTALAEREGGFRPLVYCWRGGQRSAAMVTVMDQVGWPVTQLEGGYQTWRRKVVADLYEASDKDRKRLDLVLIDGFTGVGKTRLLGHLGDLGVQTIDLEALAHHRGSLFGSTCASQPSQKAFETRIVEALERLNRSRPIVVEAESSRIGNLALPPVLWTAMKSARRIELTAPLEARVAHVLSEYQVIGSNLQALDAALARLPRHHSRDTISAWRAAAQQGRLEELITQLMTYHYDPAYRQASQRAVASIATVHLPTLSDAELGRAAGCVARIVLG
jgi:tRNA 2-selenouridine synthase